MSVLVGYVPTPEGRAALVRAVRECRLRRSRLVVINAEQIRAGAGSTPTRSPEEEVRLICAELGVDQPDVEVRRFPNAYEPADDLLAVAQEAGAELIVIGLRRRTGVGKLILGGSAQRILLDATCPVLAVKTEVRMGDRGPRAASGRLVVPETAAEHVTTGPESR
jgi:nucleotide-binding universal stress UspA family protein